ncbi:hypothetical protein KRE43_08570 [Elizabethkingia meningoseptica]|uniref:hypothetical protein n=1 Tax=Elizabethkingia TaxID=308865 RepID=UPI0016266775|nr:MULTISPECIES: hypothetical protein [Elizabethkingia]EJK5328671.1 hypothetical protein [Elizabethkingia meningoseptica]MDE5530354.1 hypothetical protein [Elizabethkingia meningoseptica]MDE5533563.1 hypothetical protein [Elizabethkingia meningoseptica]MDE5541896.1 hypothetical protein [Elizabethkingia meningoseptica]WBS76521.1 hypothetical protein PF438_08545 [Elizabethkingia meningoseptica]
MDVTEILDRVENFSTQRDYWFIRTDSGKHFDVFYAGQYIAIGWDYLTLDELNSKSESEIKEKIAQHEQLDVTLSMNKAKVTATYNKIKTFLQLKEGDIIVVPSKKSDRLAFGEVIDSASYEATEALEMGNYFKRRKIKWLDLRGIYNLDPIFFQLKINQHSISKIDRYAPYIDKIIGNLFKKGDRTHYILNFEQEEDINFRELNELMVNIDDLLTKINAKLKFNENLEDFYVKINLQSPGTMELIKTAGKSLAVLAYLLSVVACGNADDETDPDIKDLATQNHEILNETKAKIDSLKINTKELTQPFTNGK